jgi:hypothetical protein
MLRSVLSSRATSNESAALRAQSRIDHCRAGTQPEPPGVHEIRMRNVHDLSMGRFYTTALIY